MNSSIPAEEPNVEENPLKAITSNKEVKEETVIILDTPMASKDIHRNRIDVNEIDDQPIPDYLDLGLSVKWATKLSGNAIPIIGTEEYKFKLTDGKMATPTAFLNQGNQLPSIKHFEELLTRCRWSGFNQDGVIGYKITGPNGNVLILPLDILNYYLSAECLNPDSPYYYFLYLGEYSHSLAKGVPIEANIWTIQHL